VLVGRQNGHPASKTFCFKIKSIGILELMVEQEQSETNSTSDFNYDKLNGNSIAWNSLPNEAHFLQQQRIP